MASCGEAKTSQDGCNDGSEVVSMEVSQQQQQPADAADASRLHEGGMLWTGQEQQQQQQHQVLGANQLSDGCVQGQQLNRNLQGPDNPVVSSEQCGPHEGRESMQPLWQKGQQSRAHVSQAQVETQVLTGLHETVNMQTDQVRQQQQQQTHGTREVESSLPPHTQSLEVCLPHQDQPASSSLPPLSLHPRHSFPLTPTSTPPLPPAPPGHYVPQLQVQQQKRQCEPGAIPEKSQSQHPEMQSVAASSFATASGVSCSAAPMMPSSSMMQPSMLLPLSQGQPSPATGIQQGGIGMSLMPSGYLQGAQAPASGFGTLTRSPMPGVGSPAPSVPLGLIQNQNRLPDHNRQERPGLEQMPKGECHSDRNSRGPLSLPLVVSAVASGPPAQQLLSTATQLSAGMRSPTVAMSAAVQISGVEGKSAIKPLSTLRSFASSPGPSLHHPQQQELNPSDRQQSDEEQRDQQRDMAPVQEQRQKALLLHQPLHALLPAQQLSLTSKPSHQPSQLPQSKPSQLSARKDPSEHLQQDDAYVHNVQAPVTSETPTSAAVAISSASAPSPMLSTLPQMHSAKPDQVQGQGSAKQQVHQQAQAMSSTSATAAAATFGPQQRSKQLPLHQQPVFGQSKQQGTSSQTPVDAMSNEQAASRALSGYQQGTIGPMPPRAQHAASALGSQHLSVGLSSYQLASASLQTSLQTQQQVQHRGSVKQQQLGLGQSSKLLQMQQHQHQQQRQRQDGLGKADQPPTTGLKVHAMSSQGQEKVSDQPQVDKAGETPKPHQGQPQPRTQGTPHPVPLYHVEGFQGLPESSRDQQQSEAAVGQQMMPQHQPQHGANQQQGKGIGVSLAQQGRPVPLSGLASGASQQHKQHQQTASALAHPPHGAHPRNPRGVSQSSVSGAAVRSGTHAGGQNDDAIPGAILGKRSIQELVAQIDPHERLDPEVEEALLQIADDFVETTTTFACALARHRKSTVLEAKDILLHLERNWHIVIPGFGGEEYRPYRRAPTNESHKHRLSIVRKSQNMQVHHDGNAGVKGLGASGTMGAGSGVPGGVTPSATALGGVGGGGPSAAGTSPGKTLHGGMSTGHTSAGAVARSLSPAAKAARLS